MNAEQRALAAAKRRGETMCAVTMDYQEGRREYIVPLDYVDGQEFEAFCGDILCIAYPDGSIA